MFIELIFQLQSREKWSKSSVTNTETRFWLRL